MKNFILITLSLLFISCGGKQVLVDNSTPKDVQLQIMKSDVKYLASDELEGRLVGTDQEKIAAKYLSESLAASGLKPFDVNDGFLQKFKVNKEPNPHSLTPTGIFDAVNVVGFMDNGAPTTVVIGAHFDHLGYGHFGTLWDGDPAIHNGADDNASGTTVMLNLAREIGKSSDWNNNFLFLGFSGEEMGLWGSNYWVNHPNVSLNSINYMINLDMVGRLNEERALAVNGTGTSPSWDQVLDANNSYDLKLVKKESGVGPSDHTSFYNYDIPVLHFFTGQHEDYHKPSDDFDKVNYEGMHDVSSYILKIVKDLDNDGRLTFTKTNDVSEATPSFKVTLGVMPDYIYDGKGMRIDGLKPDRPASNAGMIKGDIVIKIGDIDVEDMMSYMRALGEFSPGDEVDVVIKRGEELITKKVTF